MRLLTPNDEMRRLMDLNVTPFIASTALLFLETSLPLSNNIWPVPFREKAEATLCMS
jgi:hypothetical protein